MSVINWGEMKLCASPWSKPLLNFEPQYLLYRRTWWKLWMGYDHLEVSKGRTVRSIVVSSQDFKSQKQVVVREGYTVNSGSCFLRRFVLKGMHTTLQKHLDYVFALKFSTSTHFFLLCAFHSCLLQPSVIAYSPFLPFYLLFLFDFLLPPHTFLPPPPSFLLFSLFFLFHFLVEECHVLRAGTLIWQQRLRVSSFT